jgi:hypothetical protein
LRWPQKSIFALLTSQGETTRTTCKIETTYVEVSNWMKKDMTAGEIITTSTRCNLQQKGVERIDRRVSKAILAWPM